MKEIKFRAWNCIHNRMEQVHTMSLSGTAKHLWKADDGNSRYDDFPLMQFTGRQDDDDDEIYDGDILQRCGYEADEGQLNIIVFICVVKWDKEGGKWIAEDIPSGEKFDLYDYSLAQTVIGNIYENPELLK